MKKSILILTVLCLAGSVFAGSATITRGTSYLKDKDFNSYRIREYDIGAVKVKAAVNCTLLFNTGAAEDYAGNLTDYMLCLYDSAYTGTTDSGQISFKLEVSGDGVTWYAPDSTMSGAKTIITKLPLAKSIAVNLGHRANNAAYDFCKSFRIIGAPVAGFFVSTDSVKVRGTLIKKEKIK